MGAQVETIDQIAADTYQRTRVYLFIGEHVALVDFVKALHELGALANGEYIIISIDDFDYDPNSNAQQYTSRSKLNTFHWIPFYLQIREKKLGSDCTMIN